MGGSQARESGVGVNSHLLRADPSVQHPLGEMVVASHASRHQRCVLSDRAVHLVLLYVYPKIRLISRVEKLS